jgi:hypothetical protein
VSTYNPAGPVVFNPRNNGRSSENEKAREALTVGKTYLVLGVEIGQSCSYVSLYGVKGDFNTVLFDCS